MRNLDNLQQLSKLQCLTKLNLACNPIQEQHVFYKENVFEKLPQVEILDGFTKTGSPCISETSSSDDDSQEAETLAEEVA